MITGNENLQQIAEMGPELVSIFEKYGLGSYFKAENLTKIGKFMRLSTLLAAKKIENEQFLALLNRSIADVQPDYATVAMHLQENLHFSAMLPCGIRNPFKEYFDGRVLDYPDAFAHLNYLIEGNVNHELSYYPLLDTIENIDELPDIIMASDVNNFFHRPFIEKFVEKGIFQAYAPYVPNAYLEKDGFADPSGNFTMYTANMLVMAVDKKRLGRRAMPASWGDLLDSSLENEIVMRGEDNFFCNAVMLPFYKEAGFGAIRIMARNIKSGMHPSEMVKLAGSGKPDAGCIYIMPYFFAKKIKSKDVEIVWPSDGAIASPVFMLAKKNKIAKHKAMLDFLLGKEMNEMLCGRHFPSIHPDVSNSEFPEPVKWLGWDFLASHDIGKLKSDIRDVFMEVWDKKTVEV